MTAWLSLFVQDTLRELWQPTRPKLERKSIVTFLGRVVGDGLAEGALAAGLDPNLVVVAIWGTLAQYARQHYFHELPGPAPFETEYDLMGDGSLLLVPTPGSMSLARAGSRRDAAPAPR